MTNTQSNTANTVCDSCGSPTFWLPVDGFANYEVSNKGEVRTVGAKQPLKPGLTRGYRSVGLWLNGKRHTKYVHQLVAIAFHGPRPAGQFACHYPDSNKMNNHADNLEWGTAKTNMAHYLEEGAPKYKVRRRLNVDEVVEIRRLSASGMSAAAIARMFDIHHTFCCRVINYDRWANA